METNTSPVPHLLQATGRTCVMVGPTSALLRAIGLILQRRNYDITHARDFVGLNDLPSNHDFLIADADRNPSVFENIHRQRMRNWRGKAVLLATRPGKITPSHRRQIGNAAVVGKPFRLAELNRAVGWREAKRCQVEVRRREWR